MSIFPTHRLRFTLFLFFGLSVMLGSVAFGQDAAELEVDHALTFDFTTPHTKWAQPYALGKVRVLFFSDGMGTNPRECVELMRRFDMDAQAVFWAGIIDSKLSHWHGGEVGERRMLNLLDQKWDCFVFLGIPLTNVPPEQKQKIVKAVTEGSGIVFVGADDSALLEQYNHLNPLPTFLTAGSVGDAYRIGQGLGIRLPNRPNIDYYEGWEVDYDYWQECLGRAVLWAAGKESSSRVQISISPAEPPGQDSKRTLSVTLSGKPLGQRPTLYLSVRRPGDDPVSWTETEMTNESPLVFEIPRLSEGSYHADARVMSSAGVETWATIPFQIRHDRRIAELRLDRNWGEQGGTISGQVALEGTILSNEIVRVQLLDRMRRELVRSDLVVSANQSSVPFKFEIAEWLPMLTTVEARLISDGKEHSRSYQYFRVAKRRQGQFNFLIWDFPRGTLAPYAEESLCRHGVTLQLGQGNPPAYAAASEISWVPYTTHIRANKSPEGIMKPFCWNDNEAVTRHISELVSKHEGSRQHGSFLYSLGDEIATRGSCLSPHCAATYRDYLKQTYGSLEALNSSWGTAFRTWDQIGLSVEGDEEESNSLKEKNYARWFDRQAFKSWNFVQFCRKHADAYKAIDPWAKTGFEGAGRFAAGDDLDLIVRSLDFWTPYPGLADEVIRSIATRDFIRSNWMGYTKDVDSLLQKYWRMVTLGMDSVWWWRWECIGKYHGWLAPDLRPFPAVQEVLVDTQIVRDGLGDLLLRSKMQDDGIAILYSYPSVFANKLDIASSFGGYEQAHTDVTRLVRGLGLQFRYVTDRMLRLGEYDNSEYRVLILPHTEAIGDKEAEVIRDFVLHGGTVVADFRTGIYDDHCKPRDKGALDDLFGIRRVAENHARILKISEGDGQFKTTVDPGIELAGGFAAYQVDGVPLFITQDVGKGKAILLNCDISKVEPLSSALESSGDNQPKRRARTVGRIFAGIEPPLQLQKPNGDRPENISISRWRDGDIDIVSLLRETGPDEELTVTLPRARYIYDLRNRKKLGQHACFTTTLLSNRASFFALTNEPVHAPRITLETDRAVPGSVVKLIASTPSAEGLHALHLRARLGGHPCEWLDRIVITGPEASEIDIPLAYNDPQGKYEIVATDVFTNESTVAELSVVGAKL